MTEVKLVRRVQDEAGLQAEVERDLHRLDGVVAAIRVAGVIGLAHAEHDVAAPPAEGERRSKTKKSAKAADPGKAAGNKGARKAARPKVTNEA